MISRTSNPYHYTQDSLKFHPHPLEPLLPRPAVAWWEVCSERHFVKGSCHPCTAAGEYGKDATIFTEGIFLSTAHTEIALFPKGTIRSDHSSAAEEPI